MVSTSLDGILAEVRGERFDGVVEMKMDLFKFLLVNLREDLDMIFSKYVVKGKSQGKVGYLR